MSQNNNLKELQAKWYQKLKDDGFDDIESDEDNLKVWSSRIINASINTEVYAAKEEYYRMAGKFLHDHPFASGTERYIWERHGAGVSIRDITQALKKMGLKTNKNIVHGKLKELSKLMIKMYGKS